MVYDKIENLDLFLSEYCEKEKISGFLRITKEDKILFERSLGYANEEKKIPFTKDTLCVLYSLSKPFCAIGLLKLWERGMVDIDKHPGVYLPEAKAFHSKVTLRHLLQHVSGLPDCYQETEFREKYAPGKYEKLREHVKTISAYPSYFQPGTGDRYANINFNITALIIENVSGMPYAEYMEKEVFAPLGMKSAFVYDGERQIANLAQGYDLKDGKRIPVKISTDWMFGAGDIIGTVEDVYCLNKAIKNKLFLSEKTWKEVLTPNPLNNMGFGCMIIVWHGKKRIQHNGGHTGFRTLHVQLPEDDFDIILLCNSGYGLPREIISEKVYEIFYCDKQENKKRIEMDKGYI